MLTVGRKFLSPVSLENLGGIPHQSETFRPLGRNIVNMRSFRRLKSIGAAFLLWGGLAVHSDWARAQTPVRVANVRTETLQQRQMVTGSLRAIARGDVAALESGRLVELAVRAGDTVSKGQVIAQIDDRRLQAEKLAAEAEKRVAEAELRRHRATAGQAAANLARSEKLIVQNAVSQQELERYRAESEVALAEIEAAERRIERASESVHLLEIRLSDTKVVAPYDAYVVGRHVESGDWVRPGDKLLTLVSRGPLEAWLEVPERLADAINGAPDAVMVRLSAMDRQLSVSSAKRLADVNSRVRTIQVIARIENPDDSLVAGMSVEGFVPSGRQGDYLTIPKDALVRRNGQATIFLVDNKSKAQQLPVRVLFETQDRVAVFATELKAGSRVIVEGNERLMPSQLVSVVATEPQIHSSIAKR